MLLWFGKWMGLDFREKIVVRDLDWEEGSVVGKGYLLS